jgi:hypothetical protein
MYTGLQRNFLIILKEVLKGACLILELYQLMGAQFGVDGDGIFKGVFRRQHMVEINVETLLVDGEV